MRVIRLDKRSDQHRMHRHICALKASGWSYCGTSADYSAALPEAGFAGVPSQVKGGTVPKIGIASRFGLRGGDRPSKEVFTHDELRLTLRARLGHRCSAQAVTMLVGVSSAWTLVKTSHM